ncbi:MAG: alpha/beta hydrolase, partial [Blastocatellia bacterium]
KNYRVLNDRASRAIAGLSMGGNHTLQIAVPHLEKFAYVGVYSSGLISAFMRGGPGTPPPSGPPQITPAGEAWEKQHAAKLDDANLKKGLKMFWFATGKEDFLLGTTKGTLDLLKKHGFNPVYQETPGGHTWINWRLYLNEFAPQLFR